MAGGCQAAVSVGPAGCCARGGRQSTGVFLIGPGLLSAGGGGEKGRGGGGGEPPPPQLIAASLPCAGSAPGPWSKRCWQRIPPGAWKIFLPLRSHHVRYLIRRWMRCCELRELNRIFGCACAMKRCSPS